MTAERLMISKQLKEFKGGMGSLLRCLEDGKIKNEEEEKVVDVFRIDGEFDYKRIHRLILREFKRLEDSLPIYAHRQNILIRIHGEQVKIYFSPLLLFCIQLFFGFCDAFWKMGSDCSWTKFVIGKTNFNSNDKQKRAKKRTLKF